MTKVQTQAPLGLEEVWLPKAPGMKGTSAYKVWAMEHFLVLLRHGYNYSQASERLGYTYRWWAKLRKLDAEWEAEAVGITTGTLVAWEYPDITRMSFAEFVRIYAGFTLAPHQVLMAAALEDPLAKVVLILGHPESGKSTLISLWYVLYKLAQNPDIRIAIVTKNTEKAEDLLTRIKRYLTEDHLYDDTPGNLIKDFGGWKAPHGEYKWSATQITVKHRMSGERDPSIQALGLQKTIYGARLDLLILDDALVMENQQSETTRNRIDAWFDGEARSRAMRGQVVVNGTRLLPQDLYGQWKKAWESNRLFRQVIIPAIIHEYTEDEQVTWEDYWTLDGYDIIENIAGNDEIVGYQMGMRDIRDLIVRKEPNRWKLIYQQEDVEDEQAVFTKAQIDAALELGAHRKLGQVFEHERLVLGVDPATTGRAAAILLAVDPITQVRTVIDIFVGSNLGAIGIRQQLLYQFWERYKDQNRTIDVTVIEENFVKTLRGDESLTARAAAAGTVLQWPHTTGKGVHGKWDEEYGIARMASLFGSGLMAFANAGVGDKERLAPLMDDLLVFPWSKIQDTIMALWVANGHAAGVAVSTTDLVTSQHRRGVPEVIRRRTR